MTAFDIFIESLAIFLFILTFCFGLFVYCPPVMTQTGISLVAMLSVDHCHRPNAMAFLVSRELSLLLLVHLDVRIT